MDQSHGIGLTTFHEQYSRYVLDKYHEKIREKIKHDIPRSKLPDIFIGNRDAIKASLDSTKAQSTESFKIGIIGAGAAGLYAAMILQSFGVEYEILEAQPSHIGGRLLTHRFSDGPNDYYDVGAMRFPNTYPMRRAFDLFHRLHFTGRYIWKKDDLEKLATTETSGAEEANDLYNKYAEEVTFGAPPAEGADVIDYYLSTPNDILSFNGITVNRKKLKEQGYQVFQPAIPESYVAQSVQYWLDAKVGYFKQQLKRDFTSGMKELQAYDYNSTRQFMHSLHPELKEELTEYMRRHYPDIEYAGELAYPNEVINWIETFSSGTSMYDCALTETVMDELDFNYAPDVSWKAIQGGTNRIALAMAKQLREAEYPTGRILQNKRVQKISPPPSDGSGPVSEDVKNRTMLVFVEGEAKPRVYDHVLSTVALGALRLINLDGCKLSWQLRESLRSLQYGPSVKVAIRFTHRWWESEIQNHRSGVTTTDRPTRMIVYPSYGIGSQDATMIVSYSWSQDALRLGTLVKGQGSLAEQRLIDLILQDLAEIHDIPFDDLKSWQVDYHAYNWYDNEFTVGAFAFFGPAQFRKMYQEVTQPAGLMHLYFAGEATSTNHAWVVGALDSSVRALEQIFYQQGREDLVERLEKEWGLAPEMTLKSLQYQLALGQDAGESFEILYGNSVAAPM